MMSIVELEAELGARTWPTALAAMMAISKVLRPTRIIYLKFCPV